MYYTVTTETASKVFFENYSYEQISGNKFRATDLDGSPLRLIFPTALPLGNQGHPFIPGSACAHVSHLHPIFQELQLDIANVIEITADVGIFRRNEDSNPEFEFTDGCDATDVLLMVNWEGNHIPPMQGTDCEFACRFQACYFERVEPEHDELNAELDTCGVDLWIIPRHDIFDQLIREFAASTRQEIAAGEVFYATESLVRPVYRDYMEKVIFRQLQETNPTFTAEFQSKHVDVLKYRDALDGKLTGARTQIGRFPYTLQGAQEFAALAAKHGVIQSPLASTTEETE